MSETPRFESSTYEKARQQLQGSGLAPTPALDAQIQEAKATSADARNKLNSEIAARDFVAPTVSKSIPEAKPAPKVEAKPEAKPAPKVEAKPEAKPAPQEVPKEKTDTPNPNRVETNIDDDGEQHKIYYINRRKVKEEYGKSKEWQKEAKALAELSFGLQSMLANTRVFPNIIPVHVTEDFIKGTETRISNGDIQTLKRDSLGNVYYTCDTYKNGDIFVGGKDAAEKTLSTAYFKAENIIIAGRGNYYNLDTGMIINATTGEFIAEIIDGKKIIRKTNLRIMTDKKAESAYDEAMRKFPFPAGTRKK